jgi:hypothetical protein
VTSPITIISLIVSVVFLATVIELVRRRRLVDDYAFLWIACAAALVVLSLWRRTLDVIAAWLGIYYPPVVLLLVVGAFVFVMSLSFSVIVSRQRQQIDRLVEEVAVLTARVRDLVGERDVRGEPPADGRG